ncbi:hypothetical protein [uncultured Roseibium sp.]|uniref:hypothetical protein n=1 Tax=uncultured Roseibium sp. TaxID=1936171 RepID=UPI00260DC0B2|nr:hypothetical protein [uncultured Roseibium sp.]
MTKGTGTVSVMGRRYETITFTTEEEANEFMEAFSGWGVICVEPSGLIHVADKKDKGERVQ